MPRVRCRKGLTKACTKSWYRFMNDGVLPVHYKSCPVLELTPDQFIVGLTKLNLIKWKPVKSTGGKDATHKADVAE